MGLVVILQRISLKDTKKLVQFEVNAWDDQRDSEGETRYWHHEETEVVDLESNDLYHALNVSFEIAEEITYSDFENETRIEQI